MNESIWEKIKWSLFGELRIVYWFIGIFFSLIILFYLSCGYIVLHFLQKYW